MRDTRSIPFGLFVAFAACVTPSPAPAAPRCEQPCKAETSACVRSHCRGLEAKERRECLERCRGIGGCTAIRTLAYVVTECRTDSQIVRQALRVRRGNCAPVTVMDVALAGPPDGPCGGYGAYRLGHFSVLAGVFQRLAVSPDGSGVVFEVTDEAPVFEPVSVPPGIERGFYFVRADGHGLRRPGPPSGVPLFGFARDASVPGGLNYGGLLYRAVDFSLDGQTIALTELGPGPGGETAIQIVTLDLATGTRTQVTRLPHAVPARTVPYEQAVMYPRFVDEDTILFVSSANPDGLNPENAYTFFTVDTDGTGLRAIGTPIASEGGRIDPRFEIAGGGTNLVNMAVVRGSSLVFQDVFLLDGKRLLQLTDFRRPDTGRRFLTADRRRVFFAASADPLGTNPSANCQLFSIDTLGAHLRQVTRFQADERSAIGCGSGPPPGCTIWDAFQDPATRTVVFYSSCDPFGTNPLGGQVFAMRPDGTRLRQLTATRGRTEADGAVTVELPGPIAYSARPR